MGDGADEDGVVRGLDGGDGRGTEPGVVEDEPEEGVGVQQDVQGM
jgi:hypothetical protein